MQQSVGRQGDGLRLVHDGWGLSMALCKASHGKLHARFDILLWLWAATAVCAAVSHLLLPGWTAAGTTWAMAEHWQREIAYFDLFIAFVFGWSARQADPGIKRAATMLLCGLSLLLGENHLEGWLTEARPFHVLFTLGNGLAVLWGLVACFSVRKGLEQA